MVYLRQRAKSALTRLAVRWLERCGYDMRHRLDPQQREHRLRWFKAEHAARLRYEHLEPSVKRDLPALLDAKYANRPILGTVRVYDAVAALATVIDPLDPFLGCVTQLTHELQCATAMESDGCEETLVLTALVHDIGKLLLLVADEDPMNVEAGGKKVPIAGERGGGLITCRFRWDHADFAYLRLKDHVEPAVAWLVRHHTIDLHACAPYMNDQDRTYAERLLRPFVRYDERKDFYVLPNRLESFRELIDRAFPEPILI
jgi:hypothetical protein